MLKEATVWQALFLTLKIYQGTKKTKFLPPQNVQSSKRNLSKGKSKKSMRGES